jgi:hypothetical protein
LLGRLIRAAIIPHMASGEDSTIGEESTFNL